MSILSLHRPRHAPSGQSVARAALPLAGVVAGTAVGFALAAVAHRSGSAERASLELAPDGSALEFHQGGVRVARLEDVSGTEGAAEIAAGDLASLGSASIRPTFEVEAELAREVDDVGGDVGAGPGDGASLEREREPVLSAPRA